MAKISEDEYRRLWLSPHAAVETLKRHGFNRLTVHDAILTRASAGGLRFVAEIVKMHGTGVSPYDGAFEVLSSEMWATEAIGPVFWESGDATFIKRFKPSGPLLSWTCTGIRFDPDGIDNMAAQKALPINVPKNVSPDQGKPIGAAVFDDWYAKQTPEIQALGGARLREECSKNHDGRRVIKKVTDRITKGRPLGRKRGSKNIPR